MKKQKRPVFRRAAVVAVRCEWSVAHPLTRKLPGPEDVVVGRMMMNAGQTHGRNVIER